MLNRRQKWLGINHRKICWSVGKEHQQSTTISPCATTEEYRLRICVSVCVPIGCWSTVLVGLHFVLIIVVILVFITIEFFICNTLQILLIDYRNKALVCVLYVKYFRWSVKKERSWSLTQHKLNKKSHQKTSQPYVKQQIYT